MNTRYRVALIVLVYATSLPFHSAPAQFAQQGAKLVGGDYLGQPAQGTSVAISADGNTAVVGGPQDGTSGGTSGASWIWTRSAGSWTQQGTKLVGSAGGGQGFAVAISADGSTVLVGAPYDGANGAVLVWTRNGAIWTQQGPKLVGSGSIGATTVQGWSVALSADGNTAIVGGVNDNGNIGAAWIWSRSGGVWTQQGTKLVGSGSIGSSFQGNSVSLSADGNTAIVGGYGDGNGGAAWVWTRSGGIWTQQGNKLVGSDATAFAGQGAAVSLSADGNTAIIGGFADNNGVGAAWVWTRIGGIWTQQGTKLVGSIAFGKAKQGSSVGISADGNIAVVGGPTDNVNDGSLWVWTRNGGVWTQQKLQSNTVSAGKQMGSSLALAGDGQTIIAGAPIDNQLVGSAFVFVTPAQTVPPRRHAVRH